MGVAQEIRDRLEQALAPEELTVIDESDQHAGHAGHDGKGESHFRVVIAAPSLADKSRLARHRAIHDAIGSDIISRIHALALEIRD